MYASLQIISMTHLIFSVENLGEEIVPHKARERVHGGPEKELISHMSAISWSPNDHTLI